jgi:hypothetical protein
MDLIPVHHKRHYTFEQLSGFRNYARYEPDWDKPMQDEYDLLYKMHSSPRIDFFKVKGLDLIIMPGDYIYPTGLTEQDIKDMDNNRHIHYT